MAASANLKTIRLDASLIRLSPSRMMMARLGMAMPRSTDVAATASGGEMMPPRRNPAASGKPVDRKIGEVAIDHGLVGTAPLLFDRAVESLRSEVIELWIAPCPAQDPVELKARQRPGSVFSRIAQERLQFDNWLRLTDTRIKLGELPLQFRLRCRRLGEPGRRQGVHPIDCRAQEAHCSCLKMSLSKPALGVVIKNRKSIRRLRFLAASLSPCAIGRSGP